MRHCSNARGDIRTYSNDDLKRYYPWTIIAPNIPKDHLPVTGDDHELKGLHFAKVGQNTATNQKYSNHK